MAVVVVVPAAVPPIKMRLVPLEVYHIALALIRRDLIIPSSPISCLANLEVIHIVLETCYFINMLSVNHLGISPNSSTTTTTETDLLGHHISKLDMPLDRRFSTETSAFGWKNGRRLKSVDARY